MLLPTASLPLAPDLCWTGPFLYQSALRSGKTSIPILAPGLPATTEIAVWIGCCRGAQGHSRDRRRAKSRAEGQARSELPARRVTRALPTAGRCTEAPCRHLRHCLPRLGSPTPAWQRPAPSGTETAPASSCCPPCPRRPRHPGQLFSLLGVYAPVTCKLPCSFLRVQKSSAAAMQCSPCDHGSDGNFAPIWENVSWKMHPNQLPRKGCNFSWCRGCFTRSRPEAAASGHVPWRRFVCTGRA